MRLLEVFGLEDVLAGVREAITRGVISFDAVKQVVLCRIERHPTRLAAERWRSLRRSHAGTKRSVLNSPDRAARRGGLRFGRLEASTPDFSHRWYQRDVVLDWS